MARPKEDLFQRVEFDGTPEEVSAKWRAHRKMGIGGSDAGAILGLNPWRSPLEVWMEKTGRGGEDRQNEAMEWGTRLEPAVIQKFSDEHPELTVERPEWSAVSKEHPWMFASLDGVLRRAGKGGAVERGILEAKTSATDQAWKDGVPPSYVAQVTHYLAVTGYDFAYVAVLIGGRDYREYRIERDEDDIAALIARERDFWHRYVATGTPPALTGQGNEGAALASLYPDDGDTGYADEAVEALCSEYIQACEAEKAAAERKPQLSNRLKAEIKGKKALENERVKVGWVRTDGQRFDQKAFRRACPDVYQSFCTPCVKDGGIRVKAKGE